jgi:transcriptional regulator with XRE-family HTH domain
MAMTERRFSSTKLAELIGGTWTTTRVSNYRNGNGEPLAGALRQLAETLDVSADWLLFGDEPMFRGRSRPSSEWRDEFCAHIKRELVARYHLSGRTGILAADFEVDFEQTLSELVERSERTLVEQGERMKTSSVQYLREVARLEAKARAALPRDVQLTGEGARYFAQRIREIFTPVAESLFEAHFGIYMQDSAAPVRFSRDAIVRFSDVLVIAEALQDKLVGRSHSSGITLGVRGNPVFERTDP